MASLGDEKQVYDMLLSKTALKRIAKPEEVSKVILFLLSDQSSYMTASVRLSLTLEIKLLTGVIRF